jgi:hypothetical protein
MNDEVGGNVAWTGEGNSMYVILVRISEGEVLLQDLAVGGRVILKTDVN